jgi:endonuclease-3
VTKAERADHVLRRLAELYPDPPIPLDHTDAFTLLIAVLLSAQCTDVRVNQITPKLFGELGRTPQVLAKQPVPAIEAIVKPCGLGPQKAKAILERLPGVGHKTAQVVMAQSFGVPSFPVDTHIHRLAQRWKLTDGKNVLQTERDLKRLFPATSWNKLHLQIIFYGREHCTARSCDGTTCEICTTLFPERKRALKTRKA